MKQVLVIEKNQEKEGDFWDDLEDFQFGEISEKEFLKRHSPGKLLAEFKAEVGSVFGHYTEDPKGDQVELKIVAIPDGLEGEQIEKGKEYHVLILARTDTSRCKRDEGSEEK